MGMVDGKVAIVTGATSGIGTRTVEALIEEGARVVFTGRRNEEGEAVARRLGADGIFVRATRRARPTGSASSRQR